MASLTSPRAASHVLPASRTNSAMNSGASRSSASAARSRGERQANGRMSSCPMAVPGVTVIPGVLFSLRSEILQKGAVDQFVPDPWTALLDADRTGMELYVRGWEEGDRFVPLGMRSEE